MTDAQASSVSAALSGSVVLLAEDDGLIAIDIAEHLQLAGCEVLGPFAQVADALAAAEKANVDLAVLDINLKGDAVWPVSDALRVRGVPFLFLTGYPNSGGFENWLEKPFSGGTLLSRLAAVKVRGTSVEPPARLPSYARIEELR
jgi:DNA-binding response OmpR family regulator